MLSVDKSSNVKDKYMLSVINTTTEETVLECDCMTTEEINDIVEEHNNRNK